VQQLKEKGILKVDHNRERIPFSHDNDTGFAQTTARAVHRGY
jgi:hypothetical protein